MNFVEPPAFLPPANSPKWHNRRLRDPLGYYRVRTLANANHRDPDLLSRHLIAERSKAQRMDDQPLCQLIDAATRALRRYSHGPSDESWEECVHAIDAILAAQHRHGSSA